MHAATCGALVALGLLASTIDAAPASTTDWNVVTPPQAGPGANAGRSEREHPDSLFALLDRALVSSALPAYDRLLAYLDQALARSPNDAVLHHYRGFALFRKASVLATTAAVRGKGSSDAEQRDDVDRKALFESADRELERAAVGLDWPETLALRSAVAGQLISLSGPFGVVRLGPRTSRLMNAALAAGPDNPRVWMLRGISDLYKPGLFGGGAGKAESSLRRALELFAADAPTAPAPQWGHAEAYGWLGQALARQGKDSLAREAYARALDRQPGNVWVRDVLLPALDVAQR